MRHKITLLAVALLWCTNPSRILQTIDLDSIFVVGSVNNESVPYCPHYGDACRHSYNEKLVLSSNMSDVAYHPSCCERCESDASTMRCCSELMPCKSDVTSDQGQSLVCIRTVSVLYDIGVLAVATCPEHSDNEQQIKCVQHYNSYNVDTYEVIPVRDITTRTLYRNIYCAFCNGIDIANIKFWDLRVECESTRNLSIATDSNLLNTLHENTACEFTFKDPDLPVTMETCTLSISTCNEIENLIDPEVGSSPEDKQLCLTGARNEIEHAGILYKNEYCAKCNKMSLHRVPGLTRSQSFSMLLTFDRDKIPGDLDPPDRCERGSVFNRAKRQCVEARCSLLRQLRGNICERTLPNPDSFVYRIGFRLFPKDRVQNRPRRAALSIETGYNTIYYYLGNQLQTFLLSVFPSTELIVNEALLAADVEYKDTFNATEILQADLVFIEVRVKLVFPEPHDPEEKLLELIGLEDDVTLDVVTDKYNISFMLMMTDDKMNFRAMEKTDTYMYCNYIFDVFFACEGLNSSKIFKTYQLDNLTAVPFLGSNILAEESAFYAAPVTTERNILELRKCPFVKVTRSELVWTETELGLEFVGEQWGHVMRWSEFVYGESSDTIWVCLETYEKLFSLQDGSVASCLRADYVVNAIIMSSVVYSSATY